MAETKKWSVTYTKHVKQKRKVYQDGILELHSTTHKVLLYDDCEKLLDSRFVKKDDVIISGETLAFDAYLVDIGDFHGDHNLIPNLKSKKSNQGTSDKIGPLHGKKFSNLSPSQKIIREFKKKSEIKKYSASPSCIDSPRTSLTEWQVLHTAQITQKAKKFNDGFLRLTICGSRGRQVMLYDATRRLLESKFLKKDEKIVSGESLTFDGHLVEIGDPEGDHKTKKNLNFQGTNCNAGGKADLQSAQKVQSHLDSPVAPKDAPHGRSKNSSVRSFGADLINLSGEIPQPNPLRNAHQILSILTKPMIREGMIRVSLEERNASQSSECLPSDNHIQGDGQPVKDFYGKTLPVGNDGGQTVRLRNCSGEISKSKAVDNNLPFETTVLLDNSTEESQSRILSSSNLSIGTRSGCPIMEHEASSVLLLDPEVQLPAASDWHNGSNKNVDTGDHSEKL